MPNPSLAPSAFDSDAFQRPFYRVQRLEGSLAEEVQQLRQRHPSLIVDAKIPASDVDSSRLLWSLGFRKVCMQIVLSRTRFASPASAAGAEVSSRLDLDDGDVQRHAANFVFDRFSLDPLLPRADTQRLYARWIRNSLTGGHKDVVHVDQHFCTMSVNGSAARIDLVSVLEPRRGLGRMLVDGACRLADERGAETLSVTTECENRSAWRLYQRCGFVPTDFVAVFHLVQGA